MLSTVCIELDGGRQAGRERERGREGARKDGVGGTEQDEGGREGGTEAITWGWE